jgi:phosphoglycolate phosphatase
MSGRLLLFDIDATLIKTGGVGMTAMVEAGRDLHGPEFTATGISFAGRLDPLLIEEMLVLNGRPTGPEAVGALFARYRERLSIRLQDPIPGGALPGVFRLLEALRARPEATLGLLTGNFRETGTMKLRACRIEPDHFPIQVWGADSPRTPPCRDHLPAVGIDRYAIAFGRPIRPEHVTIIGDTPLDVRCARANGCRSLGVGTGQYSAGTLREAGADHAVADLTDTEGIVRWLVDGAPS